MITEENRRFKNTKAKARRYILKLFQREDASLQLAVGFAIGSCLNFYPTFGFGIPLSIALAFITRTSIIASFIGENLFKPAYFITLPFSAVVGSMFIPIPNLNNVMKSFMSVESALNIGKAWDAFMPYAKAILLGAAINTVVFGGLLTIIAYILFTRYRHHIVDYLLKREEENI